MRFYWGLGVGHVYSHEDVRMGGPSEDETMESEDEDDTVGTSRGFRQPERLEVQDIDEDDGDLEGHEGCTNSTAEECLGLDAGEDSEGDSTEGSEGSSDGGSGYGGMDSTH